MQQRSQLQFIHSLFLQEDPIAYHVPSVSSIQWVSMIRKKSPKLFLSIESLWHIMQFLLMLLLTFYRFDPWVWHSSKHLRVTPEHTSAQPKPTDISWQQIRKTSQLNSNNITIDEQCSISLTYHFQVFCSQVIQTFLHVIGEKKTYHDEICKVRLGSEG